LLQVVEAEAVLLVVVEMLAVAELVDYSILQDNHLQQLAILAQSVMEALQEQQTHKVPMVVILPLVH
jgi:hypothetical protein